MLLRLIADFDREIGALTREIDERAKTDSRVKLLCQIKGIGRYTAMLVIAEVGEIDRFRSARHLCAWAGLTPTVRSSDGKARLGHISRQGSVALRWALVEAAALRGRESQSSAAAVVAVLSSERRLGGRCDPRFGLSRCLQPE